MTAVLMTAAVGISSDASCQDPEREYAVAGHSIPYDLETPTAQSWLPKRLDEISGLTVLDSARVAAVEDEDGLVYILDASSFDVLSEHRFRGDGDYEGIEYVGGDLYVLRSDGTLFRLRDWDHDDVAEVTRYDTPLSGRYDTEGLALERGGSALLVACKEYPGKGLKGKRTVYRFDIDKNEMEDAPALVFDAEAAERDGSEGVVSRAVRRMLDVRRFKPSGLAVHPFTSEIYVVSSVSRSLVVFDERGELLSASKLDKDLLHQPEGIAFLPDGDLLISSESNGKRGRLVRFQYRPRP
jgi:uncharacterized protein YjiK